MHIIDYEIESVTTTPEPTEDDPDPEPITEYILHINVSSKSVDTLAEEYCFTQDQEDILHELLSDEMRPRLLALCGGSNGIVEDGELVWPLPGHTTISCNFGDVDAFGHEGHRGTDIPAPEPLQDSYERFSGSIAAQRASFPCQTETRKYFCTFSANIR